MPDKGKEELSGEIKDLYQAKDELGEQIRKLDQKKIERLQISNEELEKKAEWLDKERIKITKERDNLQRQVKSFRGKKWINALRMIVALVIVDLVVVPLLVVFLGIPFLWLFISLGVITFFGILIIANYMSDTSPLDTGEVRKALVVSIIVVYFAFIPLATFGSISVIAGESIKTLVTDFTWLVAIIVIFYFGSRAVEELIKAKKQ